MSSVARSGDPELLPPVRVRIPDLSGEGPHSVSANGVDLVVVRTPAGLRAFQGRCPHRGALLGEGELDGMTLVCRNHRWRFDTEDGTRLGGPECLASYPLFEEDGGIFVALPAKSSAEDRPHALRSLEDLPGPKGLPFIGNLFQLDISRLHEILEGWVAEHGPLYRYRMGPQTYVAVADAELCEKVLRGRPETYRRLSSIEPVFDEMGVSGVFSAEGTAWRPQRRLSMEALSHRHLRDFYPTLVLVAGRLRDRWGRLADAGAAVDIVDELKRFTVDVTTLLTLGHDVNTLEQGDDVIQRKLEQIFPAFNRRLFALFPTWRLLRLPVDRRLDQALGELRDWMSELVSRARTRGAAEPEHAGRPANFLEAMVAARDDEGRPFPDELIFGNLLTMLLAGEDTTAYTLAWAVHHLCDNPPAVSALTRELDAVLGEHTVPQSFETANRLGVAGAVANETMRLRPVAPVLILETNVETVLGNVKLPAGTGVSVLLRPAVRDPENFEDPLAFRPERWLSAPAGAHEPSVHMPFGSGPRLCPGRALALLEMKLVLATLYKSFEVERRGSSRDVSERFTFTMSPAGLDVALRRRV
ncbi:MAG TPA: cytochrome P450 [Thermoanaerobaculia bacterium]|nr:cytochrome P450 [Thermoanaerobaculia bacterium]